MEKSFTVRYSRRVDALLTKCGISKLSGTRIEFNAIWDTGANISVIDKRVADKVGLIPVSKTITAHANGISDVNVYIVDIYLPNNVVFKQLRVTEGILNGTDVLIGMDIISQGDFATCCSDGKTVFSFQIPSTHNIDFVDESHRRAHTPIVNDTAHRRNDPCPCNSGKKYKHCCGK